MYKLTDLYKQLKEEEESTKSPYVIYCDMDGVLTDFDARFRYFGNIDHQKVLHICYRPLIL